MAQVTIESSGGNDPFEAKYHCSRNSRLRQVVNWHKKKKNSGVFLVSCRSLLSLFGCGFCCYSLFFFGGGLGFFPFNLVGELSPFSHPGLDLTTRSLGFFFSHRAPTSVPRREIFFGCRRRRCVFGFVISLVTEMKRRDGKGARVCRGVDGARGKANKCTLSVSIPQPKSEPEIQR